MQEIQVRFVSENEELLACSPASCTLASAKEVSLSLVFAPRAKQLRGDEPPPLRLWVHNEGARANEECIVFSWC